MAFFVIDSDTIHQICKTRSSCCSIVYKFKFVIRFTCNNEIRRKFERASLIYTNVN